MLSVELYSMFPSGTPSSGVRAIWMLGLRTAKQRLAALSDGSTYPLTESHAEIGDDDEHR